MPVYNGARYLPQAVESVLSQTHRSFEIVAIDDGSSDESADLLAGYGEPVRVYRQPNCGNVGLVRNAGIERSQGEFVAFLDQDDWWAPEKLQRQLAVFAADTAIGLVHTAARYFDDVAGAEVGPLNPLAQPEKMIGECYEDLLLGNLLCNSSVMVRRHVLDDVGGCDPRVPGNTVQDYDLWLRIAKTYRLGFVDAPVTWYRLHAGQGLSNGQKMLREQLVVLLRQRSVSEWRSSPTGRRRLAELYDRLAVAHLDCGDQGEARRYFRLACRTRGSLRQVTRAAASHLPLWLLNAVRSAKRSMSRQSESLAPVAEV